MPSDQGITEKVTACQCWCHHTTMRHPREDMWKCCPDGVETRVSLFRDLELMEVALGFVPGYLTRHCDELDAAGIEPLEVAHRIATARQFCESPKNRRRLTRSGLRTEADWLQAILVPHSEVR